MGKGALQRFEDRYIPEPMSGCWLWVAGERSTGYGAFYDAAKQNSAHRWAYETLVGPIPDGMQLDHKCRVRICVNPDHLEPVTCRENILRGNGPAAKNALKTHCPQGHPLSGRNLLKYKTERRCKECNKIRTRAWREEKANG